MPSDERAPLLAKSVAAGTAPVRKNFGWWQVGALCGILLAYSDTSLVWATHETVASGFNNLQNSSWMMTSFTIGYCVTLPLYGRLSDKYGRLYPLIAAYCVFCVGCTLCGIGQAYWQVILGRVVTGCGASGIISLASIIITDIAAPSNVAVLRSYVNVVSTVGLSFGGPAGGFIGGTVGWRWSFLGQVPIAIASCVLLARGLRAFLRRLEAEGSHHPNGVSDREIKKDRETFDYPGAITLAIWISSLLTIIDLQDRLPWNDPLLLSVTIIGSTSFVLFLIVEKYSGNRKLLIPLSLLKTEIGAFCAGQILIVGSCHGFTAQIAPYFANTQGASDAMAAWQIVPSSIGNAMGNLIAGQAIKRYGNYKRLSLISLFICIPVLIATLLTWSHTIGFWEVLATTLPYGLFAGIILSTQFIGLYICAPKEQMATAISMYYMSQQIGIALGISVISNLLKRRFQSKLQDSMIDVPGNEEIIQSILQNSSVVAQLPEAVKTLVWQSYLNSFWVVPAVVIAAQTLSLLPMLATTERKKA